MTTGKTSGAAGGAWDDLSGVRRLAELLDVSKEAPAWAAADLAEIFDHQLRAPLGFDLERWSQPDPDTTALLRHLTQSPGQPLETFGDLFRHPQPPVELLRLTKDFAKTSDSRDDAALPSEIATVLYFAAIVAARVRRGTLISQLSDDAVRQGAEWAARQPWIDGATRALFEEGIHSIKATDE